MSRFNSKYQDLYARKGDEYSRNPLDPPHPSNNSKYDDVFQEHGRIPSFTGDDYPPNASPAELDWYEEKRRLAQQYNSETNDYERQTIENQNIHDWDVNNADAETTLHESYRPNSPNWMPEFMRSGREISYHDGGRANKMLSANQADPRQRTPDFVLSDGHGSWPPPLPNKMLR
jgi:hypothetical protein